MTDIKNILLWSVSCYCLMDAASSYATFYKNQITPDNIGRLTEYNTLIDTLALFERNSSHTPVVSLPSSSLSLEHNSASITQLASVCFITDAGNCDGAGAGFESSSSSGLGPIDPDNPEMCRLEGYVNTKCNSTQNYGKPCPYDSSWHTGCVCKSEYNQTCNTPMKGVGSGCNNKYKSCCNTCPEYTYTSIPKGYVSAGSCSSCDGTKYKVTEAPCTGYKRAGDCECGYDTTSSTCLSGSSTLYKLCKACCEPTCSDESNCKYGSSQVSNGCGGYCTVCKKTGNYHCPDGTSVPEASMCKSDPDGIIIQEDNFCIILSKYQGYNYGDKAMNSTPSGWRFASLSVMQKVSEHVGTINQQLNKIGEDNLLNSWYWTNTYHSDCCVYAVNPYSGAVFKTVHPESGQPGISRAYYRYYKNCN